ncbi:MAG: FtsX-like permease family protein, partial [Gemmatimonadetes bacterium]|nr:FtsX-like permease family protein [Gemmatimonadota bacterium]
GRRPVALIYTAFAQRPGRPITIDLRAAADPDALAPAVRSLVTSLDPDQPVENLMTGERYLATSLAPVRFMTAVMGTLGALALFLAAFGLYSVLAYLVARRTRELGIRLALGAIPGDLVRLVLGRALRLVLVAVVIGFPLALGATRVLRSAIFGLTAPDPVVFIAVPAGLALVALAAAYLPARRATRVDPVDALRAE